MTILDRVLLAAAVGTILLSAVSHYCPAKILLGLPTTYCSR